MACPSCSLRGVPRGFYGASGLRPDTCGKSERLRDGTEFGRARSAGRAIFQARRQMVSVQELVVAPVLFLNSTGIVRTKTKAVFAVASGNQQFAFQVLPGLVLVAVCCVD